MDRESCIFFFLGIVVAESEPNESISGKGKEIKNRIPVGVIFFPHVQTSPGAHPASCTIGAGFFPRVKWPGRGADHPPHIAPRLKKE
jgi:hypothetical protein